VPVGAEDGFREFVESRSRDLLRTGWLLTGDWAQAEDLVQTVLLQCWPKWPTLATPEAYVRKALLNAFLSWRRRRSTRERVSGTMPDIETADLLEPAELRESVRTALAALAPRERAVVVLRYYADLSEAETAQLLGLATGSVKRYAADALAKLRTAPSLAGLLTEEVPR
jgi:RNA polymerase sigma-70 factor (sigma-E family)